ncbi:hypothetical protein [Amphritea japonica]|uniref:hypothetical protein n=1 Tax=Amphritea japonica TaxID=452627 RepID=UPI00037250AC|nr:hypothetical protein [Amphritea japonica]
MKAVVLSILGLASFLYFLFAEADSDTYYLSIFGMLFCIFLEYGLVTTLICFIGFASWHYTIFSSNSWVEFLLLPLISAGCFLYAVCNMCLLQSALRGRPIVYGSADFSDDSDA